MTYRKFKADYLFLGDGMADPDSVLITTDEGIVQAVVPESEAGNDVEVYSGVLSPGFVNCHCHLELSHMKGTIPEGTGRVDFLSTVIRGREVRGGRRELRRSRGQWRGSAVGAGDKILEGIAAGEQEMLDNGIMAVGDICNTADTVSQKALGQLYYHNFIETMGFVEQGAPARFAHSLAVFNAFTEAYQLPIESNSIVPHAPYSVSPALLRLIAGFPGNHLLTIHNQESGAENEWLLSGRVKAFLRLYEIAGPGCIFLPGDGEEGPGELAAVFV